jgi:hypothetical protein
MDLLAEKVDLNDFPKYLLSNLEFNMFNKVLIVYIYQ